MNKSFVIISSQRSGSTFIRIWLNKHSRINSYGEVFLGHYRSRDGFRSYCDKNLMSRLQFRLHHSKMCKAAHIEMIPTRLIEGYLDTLCSNKSHPAPWVDINNRDTTVAREKKPVIGFKLMWNTLAQYSFLETWLMKHRPYIIHIVRNNLLSSYVSQVRMKESKIAHSTEALSNNRLVHVDVDNFIGYAKELCGIRDRYREKFDKITPFLELSYEEIFSDLEQTKQSILGFLELEDEDMPFPEMKKMSSIHVRDNIDNYDEIEARLAGTEYESLIAD